VYLWYKRHFPISGKCLAAILKNPVLLAQTAPVILRRYSKSGCRPYEIADQRNDRTAYIVACTHVFPPFPLSSKHIESNIGQTMLAERKKSFSTESGIFPGKRKRREII
jgi:hypothetical protein